MIYNYNNPKSILTNIRRAKSIKRRKFNRRRVQNEDQKLADLPHMKTLQNTTDPVNEVAQPLGN